MNLSCDTLSHVISVDSEYVRLMVQMEGDLSIGLLAVTSYEARLSKEAPAV